MSDYMHSSTRKTSSGVVGVSGKKTRVFSVSNVGGSTAGRVMLRNGTAVTDDYYIYLLGTANTTVTQDFSHGLTFPNGCYCQIDGASCATIEFTHNFSI